MVEMPFRAENMSSKTAQYDPIGLFNRIWAVAKAGIFGIINLWFNPLAEIPDGEDQHIQTKRIIQYEK